MPRKVSGKGIIDHDQQEFPFFKRLMKGQVILRLDEPLEALFGQAARAARAAVAVKTKPHTDARWLHTVISDPRLDADRKDGS